MDGSCTLVRCMLMLEYIWRASSVVMGVRALSSSPCAGRQSSAMKATANGLKDSWMVFFIMVFRFVLNKSVQGLFKRKNATNF